MISLLRILFEQDTTSDTSSDIGSFLEPFKKQLNDIQKSADETAKNLLLVQKTQGQKQQTPTKSDATTGTTQLGKSTPTRPAGTQGPVATTKSKSEQTPDVVTSKDLNQVKDELLKAIDKKQQTNPKQPQAT